MSKKASRIIILLCALTAVALFALFLKDILVPFIRLEINNDVEGAKELLRSKGVLGCLTVALVEALQMVVIFIPAEFIQISSGLSYPFYLALLLCDLGVCLGASIIFVLVRTFKFQNDAYDKRKKTIDRLAKSGKKDRNTVLFMLLLFIMPLIPFGAICYYGSGTNIKYRNYILTVAGGVIPSIVTSNLMGSAAKAFIQNALPLWLLILIIVLLAGVLLAVLLFFLNKYFLKENDGTPDSPVYSLMLKVASLLWKRKLKVTVDNGIPEDVKAPYILLVNHQSFYDFYIISGIDPDNRLSYVANEYYLYSNPLFRRLSKKMGFIPKKLFMFDIVTPAGIFRTVRKGYPVAVFPEGRLSVDGTTNPIVEESAAFYRKLGVPLVLAKITGAYFGKPKWRKQTYRTKVHLNVEHVIRADEYERYTDAELNALIKDTLANDASLDGVNVYRRQRNKAANLERILYRCADCGALYTTKGEHNDFFCTACGARRTLNERYLFEPVAAAAPQTGVVAAAPETGNVAAAADADVVPAASGADAAPLPITTISEYYRRIAELERAELDRFELRTAVETKHFDKNVKVKARERGECLLTPEKFEYITESGGFSVPTEKLLALPFSCGEEFETYYENELYYFYPVENRNQVVRWALLVDLLKEMRYNNEH